MKSVNYYVYITTNPAKTTLYTGVTNDLKLRLRQHYYNRGKKEGFADDIIATSWFILKHTRTLIRLFGEKRRLRISVARKKRIDCFQESKVKFLSGIESHSDVAVHSN